MRSTRSAASTRRVALAVAAFLTTFQGMFAAGAGPASAAPVCTFASSTLSVVDDGAGLDSIDVWQDTAGRVFATVGPLPGIVAPDGFCGGGVPLAELRAVRIVGGTGISILTIWMSQTPFASSPTPPLPGGPGADWTGVEWSFDATANLVEAAIVSVIDGSPRDPMRVTAGASGIDLYDDGRLDVAVSGIGTYMFTTFDRVGSSISLAGGGATGPPVRTLLTYVVGGPGDDTIAGGPGTDLIVAGPGDDQIESGAGSDLVAAGAGNDEVYGGAGNDQLAGGPGDDLLVGGPGRDRCAGGLGRNTVNCEAERPTAPGGLPLPPAERVQERAELPLRLVELALGV